MKIAILLVLLATSALGASKSCPGGTLASAQTATGASADTVTAKGNPALTVQAITSAGTATVQLEISCDGTAWAQVENSPMSITTTASLAKSVLSPTCQYRANVTACSSCSVTVLFSCS